ncbi:shikimate kinase [candidate division KSB1 bacterium]|nr:shikimate kinase [candidate division KSB1 bacterium]
MDKKQLYLIGFMGAGKTTVGKLLAEKLNQPFVDIDDVIEKKADLTIPIMFEKYDEDYFRKLETDALQRIASDRGNVIATGGGIILNAKNRQIMKSTGITIYLKWHSAVLFQRIKNSTHRPLLKSINESQLVHQIETMLQQRQPFYEGADIIIDANENTSPDAIVELIIQQLMSRNQMDKKP